MKSYREYFVRLKERRRNHPDKGYHIGGTAAGVNILCNVDGNIPNDDHIGKILYGPRSANEDISNENHIENILCSSKDEAVDEGKDIKKHTHMTHKLDQ